MMPLLPISSYVMEKKSILKPPNNKQVVDSALTNFTDATTQLDAAVASQLKILHQLAPPEIAEPVEAAIQQDARDILSVVQSLKMIHSVPPVSMEVVTGFGEIWSAQTLHAYLQTQGVATAWLDAREVLVVKSDANNGGLGEKGAASTGGVVPLWEETAQKLSTWWNTVLLCADKGTCMHDDILERCDAARTRQQISTFTITYLEEVFDVSNREKPPSLHTR